MSYFNNFAVCVCNACGNMWNQHYQAEDDVDCLECRSTNIDFTRHEVYESDVRPWDYKEQLWNQS